MIATMPCPSNRADEMRESARQFRDDAAQTGWAKYVELMSRTASELERMADRMEDGATALPLGEAAATGKATRIAAELAALIAESRRNSCISAR